MVGKGSKRPAVGKRLAASINSSNAAPIFKPLMRTRSPRVSPIISAYMGCKTNWAFTKGARYLKTVKSTFVERTRKIGIDKKMLAPRELE